MPHRRLFSALALAATLPAAAQVSSTVTISGRTETISVSGFPDVPAARTPLAAQSFGGQALSDAGVASIAALTRLDAGLSDAYNAEGYWSFLTVRGFVLDNRANYRRDGLPINAETFLSLANKEHVEVLKGISGIQAGTSAPGGLVNLVVKRPTERLRQGTLEWQQDGTIVAGVDLADRFGADGRTGLRVVAQAARLDPRARSAAGSSRLLALAADLRVSGDSIVEFEVENSHRSQPSVPGLSLLGDHVPDAHRIDPRTNLNNQPWSLPVVLDGTTASLRWRQRLNDDWQLTAHAARQRLRSDDRAAFPFGCTDVATGTHWADRYCPNGNVDLYDYRSEGERRRVDSLDVHVDGRLTLAGITQRAAAGLLSSREKDRFGHLAYNFAGTGSIRADVIVPAAPELTSENTDRDERSTEIYLRDAIELSRQWQLWLGLRHSRLSRSSVMTDGTEATAYRQTFTTPWAAISWQLSPQTMLYASAGRGVETQVVPNNPIYANAGAVLPALESRQIEAGVKHEERDVSWSLTAFDIRRPLPQDRCTDTEPVSCTRSADDVARHRGIEANAAHRMGPWTVAAGASWLHARLGSTGLVPTNVPKHAARARVAREIEDAPGLQVQGTFVYEGRRQAVPDNSLGIGGWTRLDLSARWKQRLGGASLACIIGIDNVTDRRAWRESPYQFGHSYLFPLAPRTWRVSLQLDV